MSDFTMDDFRAEMARRGVDKSKKRIVFRKQRDYRDRMPSRRSRGWRLDTIDRANERLAFLIGLEATSSMPCPWGAAFGECPPGCKCGGVGRVTVAFLIEHYQGVVKEIERD